MRHAKFLAALLASAAAMALPLGAASAGPVRDLDGEGSTVRSFSGDVGDGPARFAITVPAGTALQIDVLADSGLDPVLRVFDAQSEDLILEDDDGGDDLNARAVIRTGARRRILIEVGAFTPGDAADQASLSVGPAGARGFELQLSERPYQMQARREIGWGERADGEMAAGDEHLFALRGEQGALLQAALVASDEASGLDPILQLRDESGAVVASNDDHAGGRNALVRHVFADDALYTLAASAFRDTSGQYALRIAERQIPLTQAPEQMIGLGEIASGRIGPGYDQGGQEPDAITYQLDTEALAAISAGLGAISFSLEAGEEPDPDFGSGFDPYLELGFATPLGFAVVAIDDDGGGELDALLSVDLAALKRAPGLLERMRLRVSGFGASEGAYRLHAMPGFAARSTDGDDD